MDKCRGIKTHSSMTSIAISGQLDLASQALSSRPAGTVPSPTSCALPYSSSSNNSGASDLQRAWPWHLSWSTRIFSFPISCFPSSHADAVGVFAFPGAAGARFCWQFQDGAGKLYAITFGRRPSVKRKDCYEQMPAQLRRKPVNTYHHGDLREAM